MFIKMSRITMTVLTIFVLSLIELGSSTYVDPAVWAQYKIDFKKNYTTVITEANAKFYFAYNKQWIDNHNIYYDRGQRSYKLKINQFTDMRLIHFNALFPVASPSGVSYATAAPLVNPPPTSYDPKTFGFSTTIENQGTKCNSGWAYAAVKAIEILQAQQIGNMTPASLSAQNIIDCAGRSNGCKSQVPQAAFDYLTQYGMDLLLESEYKNNNNLTEPGMCTPKGSSAVNLNKYSTITNGDDESLKAYVAAGFPVVVEFNPTSFEFMHYSEGIFQPPRTQTGSHFMVVIGYGTDPSTGTDYWIFQNSFGTTWGEMGLMRVARSSSTKITENAIFPSELA